MKSYQRESNSSLPLANMVDISEKPVIRREATAEGTIFLKESTIDLIERGKIEKGDPLQIATVGGIQAVKSTPNSLMMCHPVPVESTKVKFVRGKNSFTVSVTVVAFSKTGVEMDALNGVTAALLNIWDVVKKYEKDSGGQYPSTKIEGIRIIAKIKGPR